MKKTKKKTKKTYQKSWVSLMETEPAFPSSTYTSLLNSALLLFGDWLSSYSFPENLCLGRKTKVQSPHEIEYGESIYCLEELGEMAFCRRNGFSPTSVYGWQLRSLSLNAAETHTHPHPVRHSQQKRREEGSFQDHPQEGRVSPDSSEHRVVEEELDTSSHSSDWRSLAQTSHQQWTRQMSE